MPEQCKDEPELRSRGGCPIRPILTGGRNSDTTCKISKGEKIIEMLLLQIAIWLDLRMNHKHSPSPIKIKVSRSLSLCVENYFSLSHFFFLIFCFFYLLTNICIKYFLNPHFVCVFIQVSAHLR